MIQIRPPQTALIDRRVRGPRRPTVLVADDHPFQRDRLMIALSLGGIEVVAAAAHGLAAIDLTEDTEPDVVLIDLAMPHLSGLEAIRRLAETSPQTRIVATSATALRDEIADALLWGADAHVRKGLPGTELIAVVEAVAAGGVIIPPLIARTFRRRISGLAGNGLDLSGAALVRRELELLDSLATGASVADVALARSARPSAIAEEVTALLMKLRIEQRIEAALQEAELLDERDSQRP